MPDAAELTFGCVGCGTKRISKSTRRIPAFRRACADTLDRGQATCMSKIYTEPLYLLATPTTSSGEEGDEDGEDDSISSRIYAGQAAAMVARFAVSGSTGMPHRVRVHAWSRWDRR